MSAIWTGDKWNEPLRDRTYRDTQGRIWAYLVQDIKHPESKCWAMTRDGMSPHFIGTWGYVAQNHRLSFPWTEVEPEPDEFVVKDSGARQEYDNGFVRDVETDKPDFTRLLMIEGIELVPVEYLERFAAHMAKGALKYGRENWRLATGDEPLRRFRRSATRHFIQWLRGDRDEDHGVAVGFNIAAAEYVRDRIGATEIEE